MEDSKSPVQGNLDGALFVDRAVLLGKETVSKAVKQSSILCRPADASRGRQDARRPCKADMTRFESVARLYRLSGSLTIRQPTAPVVTRSDAVLVKRKAQFDSGRGLSTRLFRLIGKTHPW